MLKTNRIIPLVFILFLFGFTFITVAPVFAQTEGTRIPKMRGLLMDGGIMGRGNASRPPSPNVAHDTHTQPIGKMISNSLLVVKHEQLKAEHSRLKNEMRYLCKISDGGTRLAKQNTHRPVSVNLMRLCIPSTANDYGWEIK